MKKKPTIPLDAGALRRQAEERLKASPPEGGKREVAADTRRLVHELQVHQIELEMQNEELRESRAALETAAACYTDLYDFAPAGYFTLDRKGLITQTNLGGARLLGLERALLQGRPFRAFVDETDLPAFDTFFHLVFKIRVKQLCEVALKGKDRPARIVRIEAALSVDEEECRAVAVDITALKQAEERIHQLVQNMEAVREEEHKQIADELHEDIGQILTALKINLSLIQNACTAEDIAKQEIKDMQSLLSEGILKIHLLCCQLRPSALDYIGLKGTLADLADSWQQLTGIECDIEVTLSEQKLPEQVKNAVFRIIQEALTNVSRYARASRVEIRLTSDSRTLHFSIADNGCGMTPADQQKPASFGLLGIQERIKALNGTVRIESAPEAGTRIEVTIPLLLKSEKSSHAN